jgi:hypothetical protein
MLRHVNINQKRRDWYFRFLLISLVMAIVFGFFIQSMLFGIHFWCSLSIYHWLCQIGLVFFISIITSLLTYFSRKLQLISLVRHLIVTSIGLFLLESYFLGSNFWVTLSLFDWMDQICLVLLLSIIISDLDNFYFKRILHKMKKFGNES